MFGRSKLFTIIFFVAAITFIIYPQTDIKVSALFYSPEKGWFLADNFFVLLFYRSVNILSVALPVFYIAHLAISFITKKDFLGIKKKSIIFLLLVLLIGPGILVSTVFKEQVGRARPYTIQELGGDKRFTPPFVISDQCDHNCSFVSGHAAFGFYALTFAFLFKGERRKKYFKYGLCYGIPVGLGRIIQGRHFFSDTLFAFFFVYIVIRLVHSFMYRKNEELADD